MKLLIVCTAILFSLNSFSWNSPNSIAVNGSKKELAVGLKEGVISIVNASTMKVVKSYHFMSSVDKLSYDKEGKFLWVQGTEKNGGKGLFCYNANTLEKVFEKESTESVFNVTSNKVCYKKDYFAPELTILDLTTQEKIGSLKMSFTNKDAKVKLFDFSSDGSKVIAIENSAKEVCVFKGEGFISNPDKRYTANDIPTTGFGYGIAANEECIIVAGWSKTIRIQGDKCENFNRNESGGYKFCHSFCTFPNSEKFFLMSDDGGFLYNTSTLDYSVVTIDEVDGVAGNVSAIATADGETYYYITEDYVIGKINKEGFCTSSTFMDYKVDVVLRDFYGEDKAAEIQSTLKSNKFKVSVPAKHDKKNPVIIKEGISVKEAYKIIKTLRDARIQTIVRVSA